MKRWIGQSAILEPLMNRNFALFWSGQTISILGNAVYNTALPILIINLGGSATEISLANTFFILPQILFLLVGGVITDQFPKKIILLSSDSLCFFVTAIITYLLFLDRFTLVGVCAMTFLFGAVFAFFQPSANGFLPEIVEQAQLLRANSLRSISQQMARMIGPLLCGLIFSTIGLVWAFGLNAISFLISALLLMAISRPVQELPAKRLTSFRGYVANIKQGFQFISRVRWLWITLAISALSSICIAGFEMVVLPILAYQQVGADVGYSFIRSSFAIGAIGSGWVLGRSKKLPPRGFVYYVALSITGIGIFCFSMVHSIAIACVLGLLFGSGTTTFVVVWKTLIQEFIPREILGRVSSIDLFISVILLPIGYLIIGQMTKWIGNEWMTALCGGVLTLLGMLGISFREIRALR